MRRGVKLANVALLCARRSTQSWTRSGLWLMRFCSNSDCSESVTFPKVRRVQVSCLRDRQRDHQSVDGNRDAFALLLDGQSYLRWRSTDLQLHFAARWSARPAARVVSQALPGRSLAVSGGERPLTGQCPSPAMIVGIASLLIAQLTLPVPPPVRARECSS